MVSVRRTHLEGRRFGKLLVLELSSESRTGNKWLCRCDCGTVKQVWQGHLLRGKSRSCGCSQRTQDGHATKHPMWWRWSSMIERCEKKYAINYNEYGGRGISVCDRWHKFSNFLEDMEDTFFEGATLDRIDNNGNYEPGNVQWVTPKQQNANQRRTVFVDTPNGRMTRSQAAALAGMPIGRFTSRHEAGWSLERLFDPANREPLVWCRKSRAWIQSPTS